MIDVNLIHEIEDIIERHYKYNGPADYKKDCRYNEMLDVLSSVKGEIEERGAYEPEECALSDERIIKALEERRKLYRVRIAGAEFALEEENQKLIKLCKDIDALKFKKWQHDQCK